MPSMWDLFPDKIVLRENSRFPPYTPCWEWMGPRDEKGYGLVSYEGQRWRAHVLAIFLKKKKKNFKKPMACHTCDNTWCVNPAHIFNGTNRDNQLDRLKWVAGLSKSDIEHIRNSTISTRALASGYNVAIRDIEAIRPPKIYKIYK